MGNKTLSFTRSFHLFILYYVLTVHRRFVHIHPAFVHICMCLLWAELQVHSSTTLYYWWARSCTLWTFSCSAGGMDSK